MPIPGTYGDPKKHPPGNNPSVPTPIVPSTLSPSVWYRADQAIYQDGSLTIAASKNGDTVQGWADGSTNSNNALGATTPGTVFRQASAPYLAYCRFDPIVSLTRFTSGSALNLTPPYTLFALGRFYAVPTTQAGLICSTTSGTRNFGLFYDPTIGQLCMSNDANSFIGYPFPITDFKNRLWSCEMNGSTSNLYENGVLKASGSLGSNSFTVVVMGVLRTFPVGLRSSCDLGEVIVFPSLLSTANRQGIEQYLTNKWGGL